MKLNKYFKYRSELETFSFEKNFNPLSKTLYYFSFLGNIFLILFSYFFIKDVTNSIPQLFVGQSLFFSIFIILFMTGYELFKRFAFEQLTFSVVKLKKLTTNIALGTVVCLLLVIGSFYLSLKGAHRLIDTSEKVQLVSDSTIQNTSDSIASYYKKEIDFYRSQPAKTKSDRKYRDSIVSTLEQTRDTKIAAVEQKISNKSTNKMEKVKENDFAFAIMVLFLEFIILIGVAFSTYYEWTSYDEMKKLMVTPKYKQLEVNLNLLKLYYQNGRKKEQDYTISKSKLIALTKAAKLNVTQSDVTGFIALCSELEIITGQKRKKTYNMSYEKAKTIIEINNENY